MDEEAAMSGNSHLGNITANTHVEPARADSIVAAGSPAEDSNPRKEKSVLQAKLTKLAIQIGYVGKLLWTLFLLSPICSGHRGQARVACQQQNSAVKPNRAGLLLELHFITVVGVLYRKGHELRFL